MTEIKANMMLLYDVSFVFSLVSRGGLRAQDFCGTGCHGRISHFDFHLRVGSETIQVQPAEKKVTTLYLYGFPFSPWPFTSRGNCVCDLLPIRFYVTQDSGVVMTFSLRNHWT